MYRGLMPWLLGCLLFGGLLSVVRAESPPVSPPKETVPLQKQPRETLTSEEATLLLDQELDRLRAGPPPKLKIQRIKSLSLPKGLSPDLADTSRKLLSFSKAFSKARARARKKETLSFGNAPDDYWPKIDAFVANDRSITADNLMAYRWYGSCSSGSEDYVFPNSMAVFIALIREQRFADAAGAALSIPPPPVLEFQTEPFWKYLGFDYQTIIAAQLITHPYFLGVEQFKKLADGTEKGANLLIEATRFCRPGNRSYVIAPLGGLLKSPQDSLIPPLPLNLQKEIIALLDDLSQKNASFGDARLVAEALGGVTLPEAREVLKRLYHHPSKRVSSIAADGLGKLGETLENRPAPPLASLLIQVNGAPYRQSSLRLQINGPNEPRETSTDGILTFERELLLDPGNKPNAVFIRALYGNSPDTPLFYSFIPLRKALDENPYTVNITTKPVDLLISYPDHFKAPEGTEIEVKVCLTSSDYRADSKLTFKTAPVRKVRLAALQPGTYEIEAKAPGTTIYRSGKIKLNGGDVFIRLKRGADVPIESILPKGESPYYLQWSLSRNGTIVDWHPYFHLGTNSLQGLPEGDYVIKLASSADHKKELIDYTPKAEFKAVEKHFRIDKNSPPVINLGEIPLPEIN